MQITGNGSKLWPWAVGLLVSVLIATGSFSLGHGSAVRREEVLMSEVNAARLNIAELSVGQRTLVSAVERDRRELLETLRRIEERLYLLERADVRASRPSNP